MLRHLRHYSAHSHIAPFFESERAYEDKGKTREAVDANAKRVSTAAMENAVVVRGQAFRAFGAAFGTDETRGKYKCRQL